MAKTEKKSKSISRPVKKPASARVSKTKPKISKTKSVVSQAAAPPDEVHKRAPLPSVFTLTKQVVQILTRHWRTLFGIVLVYLALNIIFASGFSNLSSAVSSIKADFNNTAGQSHTFAKALSGFAGLVGSAGASGSASASVLQSALFVLESLVIIWALRQLLAGKYISVKEAYYHSTYPLVPFLLVIFVIIIQLLPISFGALLLSAITTSDAAGVTMITWAAWLIFGLLAWWSFYMLSCSIFALYIVTLPEMQPREALRSAKNLVQRRRSQLMAKLIFLPVLILVVMGIIIIPLILLASGIVAPVFYILSMFVVLFIHTYLYSLYRSLLA